MTGDSNGATPFTPQARQNADHATHDDFEDMLPFDSDVEVDDTTVGRRKPIHLTWAYIGLVAAGGMLGTAAREGLVLVIPAVADIPLAIVIINIVGALFLGGLLESLARRGPDEGRRRVLRLMLGTGFAGGFTTYSALAADTAVLLTTGSTVTGIVYAIGTVLVGAAATFVGIATAAAAHRRRIREREVTPR